MDKTKQIGMKTTNYLSVADALTVEAICPIIQAPELSMSTVHIVKKISSEYLQK